MTLMDHRWIPVKRRNILFNGFTALLIYLLHVHAAKIAFSNFPVFWKFIYSRVPKFADVDIFLKNCMELLHV